MRARRFVATGLALVLGAALAGCGEDRLSGPRFVAPERGALVVEIRYDEAEAAALGADSALVRVRNLFLPAAEYRGIQRVALQGSGATTARFVLPAVTGYTAQVIAYASSNELAFAGAEQEHHLATTVQRDGEAVVSLSLSSWRTRLEPPLAIRASRAAAFAIHILEAPAAALPGPFLTQDEFVWTWGLILDSSRWDPESPPPPVPPGVLGAAVRGTQRTHYVYHAVEGEAVPELFAQGFLLVGGPEWTETAGGAARGFRHYTDVRAVRVELD